MELGNIQIMYNNEVTRDVAKNDYNRPFQTESFQ